MYIRLLQCRGRSCEYSYVGQHCCSVWLHAVSVAVLCFAHGQLLSQWCTWLHACLLGNIAMSSYRSIIDVGAGGNPERNNTGRCASIGAGPEIWCRIANRYCHDRIDVVWIRLDMVCLIILLDSIQLCTVGQLSLGQPPVPSLFNLSLLSMAPTLWVVGDSELQNFLHPGLHLWYSDGWKHGIQIKSVPDCLCIPNHRVSL